MSPAPPGDDRSVPGEDAGPPPGVRQDFSAYGQARVAAQASGIQNVYLDGRGRNSEPVVSLVPPIAQRDDNLPIRGRDDLLSELAAGSTSPRVWVIHGLGGSGKTRLALEVAFGAGNRGAAVWWVSATDPDALVAGMRAVGRRLGVAQEDLERGDAADILWERLAAKRGPWLLVIDGADDPQMLFGAGNSVEEGRGWLRPVVGKAGMVLVTSRDGSSIWGSSRWCHRRRLGMLSPADAAAMLADHAGEDQRLGSESDARTLAARLGGLPLALKIAGSYLANSAAIPAALTDRETIVTYQGYRDAMGNGQQAENGTQSGGR